MANVTPPPAQGPSSAVSSEAVFKVPRRRCLRTYALAGIAAVSIADSPVRDTAETTFLRAHLDATSGQKRWPRALIRYLQHPSPADKRLTDLAVELSLNPVETLAVTLAIAVETDVMAGRVTAHVQAPLGGSRPTLGLVSAAYAGLARKETPALESLLIGPAIGSGLLTLSNETAPVPERQIAVPLPLCVALLGHDSNWPGATIGMGALPLTEIPPSITADVARHAVALETRSARVLVLRSSSSSEARSISCALAHAMGCRAAFIDSTASISGLAPWLILRRLLPVFCFELGPGERKSLPSIPFYNGPVLALCGREGSIDFGGEPAGSWTIAVPPRDERRQLWTAAIGNQAVAHKLAQHHRHGSGRIAHLGRLARHQAALAGRNEIDSADVVAASRIGEGAGLDTLAQPLTEAVPEDALALSPTLRAEFDRLHLRCLSRDGLADGLGVSASTRYLPGVRALFTGPSGTGKTLAAGWLATRLGLPLYRVDLSSVTSKYIGETEKNLAQLLARAEHAEVVLLFDEADSLFGHRTEIREANDRFANAQTNYLLQRIETFDGIAILTANSRARFDSAFARRLDAVLEFPPPGPELRRSIWSSHLGDRHALTVADLNQIAFTADLCGGNIRNAVFAAAVLAHSEDRPIAYADVVEGIASEYRKLGRQMPVGLVRS